MSNVVRLEYAYGVCPKCKVNNYLRYLIHNDGLVHKPYEIKCLNCNSYFAKEDIFGSKEESAPKPMTNYSRLVSKTPEELARWIASRKETCPPINGYKCSIMTCEECWLDWLKQEVNE